MRKTCEIMSETALFRGINSDIFRASCEHTEVTNFTKGEVVAREGDSCAGLGIIVEGQLALQKYSSSGENSTLSILGAGESFGQELIFSSKRRYNFSLEAINQCKLIMVPREDILAMIAKSPQLLINFLQTLSDELRYREEHIHLLSQRTLRQKISCYLLELYRKQLAEEGETFKTQAQLLKTASVELPVSKEIASRLLAIPRPSFSRELISMEKDGLIKVAGRVIWLLDLGALESGIIVGEQDDDEDSED
ncbi:MAG: Crp/Fnr family transcriptional regulator [Eubacteriales bacterium]|nr:Crp/Fnr family transcriptional regulator [Eubacteriales bacterium]